MTGSGGFEGPTSPPSPMAIYTSSGPPLVAGLPPGVREKLELVYEHADAKQRLVPEFSERHALNSERGDAQRRLDRLLAHPQDNPGGGGAGFGLRPDDPRVIQQKKLVEELSLAADKLNARYERTRAASQAFLRTRTVVTAWLKDRPGGTVVTDWVGTEPKPAKGEDILASVARLERRCRELRADLSRVEAAPVPLAHAKARVRDIVATLAQQGAPNVSPLIEHEHGEVWWPTQNLQATVFNTEGQRPIAFTETQALLPTLAWLFPDVMAKRLDAMLTEEANEPNAIGVADRQKMIAQIGGDLLAVERDLCWFVWRGLDAHLPVWFADDVSPAAILGAELVTRPTRNEGGSSPERGAINIIEGRL